MLWPTLGEGRAKDYREFHRTRLDRRLAAFAMPEPPAKISQRMTIGLIMGGLVVWAIYIAVGAYLYNLNIKAALLVLGCVGAFIGFWLLMLWTQGPPANRD